MNDLAGSVEEALARAEAVRFGGFYPREPGGRWTNGTGAVRFVGSITSRYVGVEFAVHNPRGSRLRIRVNDRTVVEGHFGPGMHRREIATPDPVRNITFDSDTFVPRDSGMNEDWRRLGVAVSRLTLY